MKDEVQKEDHARRPCMRERDNSGAYWNFYFIVSFTTELHVKEEVQKEAPCEKTMRERDNSGAYWNFYFIVSFTTELHMKEEVQKEAHAGTR